MTLELKSVWKRIHVMNGRKFLVSGLLLLVFALPVTLAIDSGQLVGEPTTLGTLLVAYFAALAAVALLVFLQSKVDPKPATFFEGIFQYAIVLATPLWLFYSLCEYWLSNISPAIEALVLFIAIVSISVGVTWVLLSTWGAWRQAKSLRDELAQSVRQEEHLNELLSQAEDSRFTEYRSVIKRDVGEPLVRLLASMKGSGEGSNVLADRLDGFQNRVMRPLAHKLHPVTLRVGLIPAIQSLETHYSIHADESLRERDSQATLLDLNVVPQIFRWIRHLKSYDGGVSLTLTTDSGRLLIIARGVRVSRTLDPIQVVAGLRVVQISHDEIHLHAPLLGVTAVPMQHGTARKSPVAEQRSTRWRLWTQPPSISINLILYIGMVSAPAFHLVRGDAMASEGPALTLLSVVLPALIAIPLTRVRIRTGTRQGAFRVVGMWLFLAAASAILSNAVIALMAPRYQLPIGSGLRVFGAVMRYAVVGLSFTVTRGFLVQSGIDTAALKERKAETEDTRLEVLGNADATDRYLAEALHRSVQGRLAAISLLLRLDRREEAFAELQSLVSKTLPDIEIRLGQWTRNEISELAINVIQVPGLDISDEVDWSTLGVSQAELEAQLRRVINEMAVNAIRHGAASDMRVQLITDGPIVTLLCTDNGQGPSETLGSGLGSALLNEICSNYEGSWSLYRENESTIVRLVLTVADFEPQSV